MRKRMAHVSSLTKSQKKRSLRAVLTVHFLFYLLPSLPSPSLPSPSLLLSFPLTDACVFILPSWRVHQGQLSVPSCLCGEGCPGVCRLYQRVLPSWRKGLIDNKAIDFFVCACVHVCACMCVCVCVCVCVLTVLLDIPM